MSARALAWAWTHVPTLKSAPAKLVLVALADRADDDGELYPKLSWVAEKVGMDRRNVRRHVATLEELGLLARDERRRLDADGRQTSNLIRLGLPREGETALPPRAEMTAPPRAESPHQETTTKETTKKETSELALAVHAYYSERRGTTRSLSPGTAKLIDRAGNAGFNVIDLKLAVDGLLGSDWHREHGHLTLSTIFKTGPGTESFEDRVQGFVDRALSSMPPGSVAGNANVPDWIRKNLRVGRENSDDKQAVAMATNAADWLAARGLVATWDNGRLTIARAHDEAA